jgi:hypothetical protein
MEHGNNCKEIVPTIRWTNILEALLWVSVMAYTITFHYGIITMPAPGEMREGSAVAITRLLSEGGNPYETSNLPTFTYVYGILYNLTVMLGSFFADPNLTMHRTFSGAFLLMGSVVIFLILNKTTKRVNALRGAGLFYLINCYSYSILARPDTLGLLLMLLCIYMALQNKNMLSITFAVLAFLTKPYFFFGLGVSALLNLKNKGLKGAVVYFLQGLLSLTLTLLVIKATAPNYLYITVGLSGGDQKWNLEHFLSQLRYWGMSSLFLIIGCILRVKSKSSDNIVWIYSLLTGLAILLLGMGWHKGAFLIYYLHIVSPFLILVFMTNSMKEKTRQLLTIGQLILTVYLAYPLPRVSSEFVELKKEMLVENSRPSIIMTSEIGDLTLLQDNGQTEYFLRHTGHLNKDLRNKASLYKEGISKDIESKRWDNIWTIAGKSEGKIYITEGLGFTKVLSENYTVSRVYKVGCYFATYKSPHLYGKGFYEVLKWSKNP